MKPEELLYAKTHEWVSIAEKDGAKIATLGLSAFAIEELTDLVFIELPKVGEQVEAGAPFCEVESVKAVSDVYAPVTGEVVAANSELPEALDKLGDDPYNAGWIAKIKVTDDSGLSQLMDLATYEKQCNEEAH